MSLPWPRIAVIVAWSASITLVGTAQYYRGQRVEAGRSHQRELAIQAEVLRAESAAKQAVAEKNAVAKQLSEKLDQQIREEQERLRHAHNDIVGLLDAVERMRIKPARRTDDPGTVPGTAADPGRTGKDTTAPAGVLPIPPQGLLAELAQLAAEADRIGSAYRGCMEQLRLDRGQ